MMKKFFCLSIFLFCFNNMVFANINYPTSIEDFHCGEYLLAAKFKVDPEGEDYLVFYADTDREFQVPILQVPAEKSFIWDGSFAVFEVSLPRTKQGKKQGRFYLKNFRKLASYKEVYEKTVRKVNNRC